MCSNGLHRLQRNRGRGEVGGLPDVNPVTLFLPLLHHKVTLCMKKRRETTREEGGENEFYGTLSSYQKHVHSQRTRACSPFPATESTGTSKTARVPKKRILGYATYEDVHSLQLLGRGFFALQAYAPDGEHSQRDGGQDSRPHFLMDHVGTNLKRDKIGTFQASKTRHSSRPIVHKWNKASHPFDVCNGTID
jgi:hypothetical protein